jgi:hypothetical protein
MILMYSLRSVLLQGSIYTELLEVKKYGEFL